MNCPLCLRPVGKNQDAIHLLSMPLISLHPATCHLICYQLRAAQVYHHLEDLATNPFHLVFNQQTEESKEKKRTCKFCNHSINNKSESYIRYTQCKHTSVHLRCASLLDFSRKHGCPLCSTPTSEQTEIEKWRAMSSNSKTRIEKEKTRIREAVARFIIDPKPQNRNLSLIYTINTLTLGVDTMCLKQAYEREFLTLPHPRFRTLLRQTFYELNQISSPDSLRDSLIELFGRLIEIYSTSELKTCGLNPHMIVRYTDIFRMFTSKEDMPWMAHAMLGSSGLKFDMFFMLMSGRKFDVIMENRIRDDLFVFDYSVPLVRAAGYKPLAQPVDLFQSPSLITPSDGPLFD